MKRLLLFITVLGLIAVAIVMIFRSSYPAGDPTLTPFVQGRPTYPIVFTSRTDPTAFRAAAERADYTANGNGLKLPGAPSWQAREGRLRLLGTDGQVRELTWGQPLPDGGTLIDVMSPTITPDGKVIVFAGRRADADGGRFRIYAIDVNGRNLRQLTGGAADPGCKLAPPARYDVSGQVAPLAERCRIDYDDIDPTMLPGNVLVFASSRLPDLGGGERRATQIWMREPNQPPRSMSANRANDRWPFIGIDRAIMFSLWSRQDEVIADDSSGIVRYSPARAGLTRPADRWLGASLTPTGEHFTQIAKLPEPVWRPRPLANGRIVLMTLPPGSPTPFGPELEHPERGILTIGQTDLGRVASAPSSLATDSALPTADSPHLLWAPTRSSDGRSWSLATPTPAPPDAVLAAAAPVNAGQVIPADYGIVSLSQDGWSADRQGTLDLRMLFDDPAFVDAEPIAVYARPIPEGAVSGPEAWPRDTTKTIPMVNGKAYTGLAAQLQNAGLFFDETTKFPGQTPNSGKGLIFPPFPRDRIAQIAFYTAHRDRFDDAERPVIRGELEKSMVIPVNPASAGGFDITVPAGGSPTLLVGLDADGKVSSVDGAADAQGRRPRFYAFAGDHVSGARPGGYHFCTGCHTGHTFNPSDIRERLK